VKRLILSIFLTVFLISSPAGARVDYRIPHIKHIRSIANERFPEHCKPVYINRVTEELGDEDAEVDRDRCMIRLDHSFPDLGYISQCSLIVHEYGHLAGREHVDNPNHIMHQNVPAFKKCRLVFG